MMVNGSRLGTVSRGVACWVAATAVAAAAQRPSWECLPADTGLMVRLPRAAEFIETLRSATRFGSVMLRSDRLDGVWHMLVEQLAEGSAEERPEWEEALAKYGLEAGDPAALFAGDLGGGLVVRPRQDLPPLTMLLAWAEPGEAAAGRLLAAAKRRLEEAAEGPEESAPRRIDLELAGREVLSAVQPVTTLDMGDVEFEDLADEDGNDEADMAARLRARLRDAKLRKVGETYTFLTVVEGRILVGQTFPTRGEDAGSDEWEAVSGGEEAREIFGAFLAAHEGEGESALAATLREPALAAAVPPGLPLVELVALPRRLVAAAGGDDEAGLAARLGQLGLDDVGGVAWWQSFDAGRWRSTIAATLPAPRHGLLAMLDQPCDACDVPPFVTREAVEFLQVSLDLGKAFASVREVLVAGADAERVATMFNVADVQATTFLGADAAAVLSALGSRHWVVTFPPRIKAALAAARQTDAAGRAAGSLPGADSIALVWRVTDENPFLKLLGRLAPMAGGQLQEEQGFRGIRVPGAAAAFVGRDHLVLAVGEGTLEKVLAAIRNPPAGELAWRESDSLGRARQLVDMQPARMFGLSDATRTGGGLGTVRELVAALEPGDVPDEARDLLAAGQKLLPTEAEMEGMFGVGASVLRLTDDGPVRESAWEMPRP